MGPLTETPKGTSEALNLIARNLQRNLLGTHSRTLYRKPMETSKPIETLSKEPAEKIFEESLTGPLKKSLWKLQNPIETLEGALYRDLKIPAAAVLRLFHQQTLQSPATPTV